MTKTIVIVIILLLSVNLSLSETISSFSIISKRNIFDSNRMFGGTNKVQQTNKVDSFYLTGVLLSDKGKFAFFDGTPNYLKVLESQDMIAGHKIVGISSTNVVLELNGTNIELRVGMKMSRQNEGEWIPSTSEYSILSTSQPVKRQSFRPPQKNRR